MSIYNWFKNTSARSRRLHLSTQAHDSELVIQPKVQEDKLRKRFLGMISC